jgi:hypothetical protein
MPVCGAVHVWGGFVAAGKRCCWFQPVIVVVGFVINLLYGSSEVEVPPLVTATGRAAWFVFPNGGWLVARCWKASLLLLVMEAIYVLVQLGTGRSEF